MSCNRDVRACLAAAGALGVPAVEATWAEGKKQRMRLCPTCHNSFLRADGGCTKCEERLLAIAAREPDRVAGGFLKARFPGWAMAALSPVMAETQDPKLRRAAVPYLTDPAHLDALSRDRDVGVQAQVAANPYTSPAALSWLLAKQEGAVYQQAAANPSLAMDTLTYAAAQAEKRWLDVFQRAMYQFSMGASIAMVASRGGRTSVLPLMVAGMYGRALWQSWRRHTTLQRELKRRQRSDPAAHTRSSGNGRGGGEARLVPSPAQPTPWAAGEGRRDAWDMVGEELRLMELTLKDHPDFYGEDISDEDVSRIQRQGIQSDRDAGLMVQVLRTMRQNALDMPGWYEGVGAGDFQDMEAELVCPECGRPAGRASHRCLVREPKP